MTALEAEAHVLELYAASDEKNAQLAVAAFEVEEARARLARVEIARSAATNPRDDWARMTGYIAEKKKPRGTFRNPVAVFVIVLMCALFWIGFVSYVVMSAAHDETRARESCARGCVHAGQFYDSLETVGNVNVCRCRR